LNGQLAIPGFIEGHGHFTGIGENRLNLDLLDTTSWEQIVSIVADAVKKARPASGSWGAVHQDKWTKRPSRTSKDSAPRVTRRGVANNPVVLGTPAVTARS